MYLVKFCIPVAVEHLVLLGGGVGCWEKQKRRRLGGPGIICWDYISGY